MESFSRFLAGMGYPPHKLKHPGDGRLSHSPYENSLQIAGLIAWYYEHEAMMPMMVGHSQGGIQLVKVLHDLAGDGVTQIAVWNPRTDAAEPRVDDRRSLHRRRASGGRPEDRLRVGGRLRAAPR